MVHAQFETIHPFLDGNGRVGRLLITFLLCERHVLERPLLYLSYFFKKHRPEYYVRLQDIRHKGDWEGWLKFFLRGVAEVAREATEKARRIVGMREKHRTLIGQDLGQSAGNGLNLLEYLYGRPIANVNQAAEYLNVSFATANRLIGNLCNIGILQETTGQARNRIFAYRSYIRQFSDDETDTPTINS